ncbi:hypothetical protein BDQ12DRAFT_720122 [Crucibulum laeve]|uniref:Beta/gamma crystallin 'Greek key' domain-containing protein n=1 Tax=Crucibulum laeve TaxID=68775 RepID=A0A5C3MBI5_9AGAR|nr:hypothetical protein BDQ12DRAFT_720122 [Crucibulum laeve]
MLKLYALVGVLAACVGMAAAGGTVVFCTDENMQGHCVDLDYNNNDCINFGSGLNDLISSLDPEGSGHSCTLYKDYDCKGDTFGFTKHHDTLPGFNDVASSFRCTS